MIQGTNILTTTTNTTGSTEMKKAPYTKVYGAFYL